VTSSILEPLSPPHHGGSEATGEEHSLLRLFFLLLELHMSLLRRDFRISAIVVQDP
jgi:hypothetical protein